MPLSRPENIHEGSGLGWDLQRLRKAYTATPEDITAQAFQRVQEHGGATIDLRGHEPSSGYAYSPFPELERIIPLSMFTPEVLGQFMADAQNALAMPGNYLGVWVDGPNVFMDISHVNPDYESAIQEAKAANQLAIFDLSNMQEIPTGVQRSREMTSRVAYELPITPLPRSLDDHWLQWQPGMTGKGFILENGKVWTWPTINNRPMHLERSAPVQIMGGRIRSNTTFHITDEGGVYVNGPGRFLDHHDHALISMADHRLKPTKSQGGFGHSQEVYDKLQAMGAWNLPSKRLNSQKFITTDEQHEQSKKLFGLPKPHNLRKVIPFRPRKGAVDQEWLDEWIKYNGPYFLHETTGQATRDKILREGLIPHDQGPGSVYGGTLVPRANHSYIAWAKPRHWNWMDQDGPEGFREHVFVDLRNIDPDRINADEDAFASSRHQHTFPDIPVAHDNDVKSDEYGNRTRVVTDEHGRRYKDWGEFADHHQLNHPHHTTYSINDIGTACVEGGIPPDALAHPADALADIRENFPHVLKGSSRVPLPLNKPLPHEEAWENPLALPAQKAASIWILTNNPATREPSPYIHARENVPQHDNEGDWKLGYNYAPIHDQYDLSDPVYPEELMLNSDMHRKQEGTCQFCGAHTKFYLGMCPHCKREQRLA